MSESYADKPCSLVLLSDESIVQKINERRPSDGEHIKYEVVQTMPLSYQANIRSAYNWRLLLESGFNAIKTAARNRLQELKDHSFRGPMFSPTHQTHTRLLEDNYVILYSYLRAKGFRAITVADIRFSPVLKQDEQGQFFRIDKVFRVPALVILPTDQDFDLSSSQITLYSQIVSGIHIDEMTNIRYLGMDAIIDGVLDTQPTIHQERNSKLN